MAAHRTLQLISSGGFYGAENMVVQLSRALKLLDCKVVVGVFRNAHCENTDIAEKARDCGLDVEFIDCAGRFDSGAIEAIRSCLRRHQINILHTHGYKADFYGWCAARKMGIKLVATCHNWPGNELSLRAYAVLDRFFLRQFSAVVAVSDLVAQVLQRSGVAPSKVMLIYNGIDVDSFRSGRLHAELGKRSGTLVGLVGRLVPEKGGEYLLRAMARLISEFPRITVVFVGDGPFRKDLQNLADKLGIERNVTFLGRCTDMPSAYAAFDVVTLPSVTEGLPLSILEAMAAGKAIVATRVGSIPTVLSDGVTGLLVPPKDVGALAKALEKLLSDARFCSSLGHSARKQVRQHFSAARMAQDYRELYKALLSNVPTSLRAFDGSRYRLECDSA